MTIDLLTGALHARARVRAERGAWSLPFTVLGVVTVVFGALGALGMHAGNLAAAPTIGFLALLGVAWLRCSRRGVGLGSDGYVFLGIVGGLLLLALPVIMLVGPIAVLGAGMVLLGVRGRDPEMGAAGGALAIAGWLVARPLSGIDAGLGGVMLAAAGTLLVTFGLVRRHRENRLLQVS